MVTSWPLIPSNWLLIGRWPLVGRYLVANWSSWSENEVEKKGGLLHRSALRRVTRAPAGGFTGVLTEVFTGVLGKSIAISEGTVVLTASRAHHTSPDS